MSGNTQDGHGKTSLPACMHVLMEDASFRDLADWGHTALAADSESQFP